MPKVCLKTLLCFQNGFSISLLIDVTISIYVCWCMCINPFQNNTNGGRVIYISVKAFSCIENDPVDTKKFQQAAKKVIKNNY